jgi:predicted nucleic acid-binding protein
MTTGALQTSFVSFADRCRPTILNFLMIVVDASLLIDAARGTPRVTLVMSGIDMHAPATIDVEVLHGLRRAMFVGRVNEEQVESAITMLRDAPITRHWIKPYLDRIWALRHNITAYDAAYVALAESLGYPLLTRDRRLAHSSGHAARIEYID